MTHKSTKQCLLTAIQYGTANEARVPDIEFSPSFIIGKNNFVLTIRFKFKFKYFIGVTMQGLQV